MKTIIFVHGAYHAGWCWDKVVKLLPKDAFDCHSLDLPANGSNNSIQKKDVTTRDYINYVIEYINSNNLSEVVLVSHSLGGITISKVIERIPEKISRAFFLTSVILNNKAFFSLLPSEVQEKYRQIASSRPDNSIPPNLERVKQVLFNGSQNSEELDVFLSKLEPQPIQPYEDIIALNTFRTTTVPITYIKCKNDISLPEQTFNGILSLLPENAQIETIDADHEAMFSNPEAIAGLLLRQA